MKLAGKIKAPKDKIEKYILSHNSFFTFNKPDLISALGFEKDGGAKIPKPNEVCLSLLCGDKGAKPTEMTIRDFYKNADFSDLSKESYGRVQLIVKNGEAAGKALKSLSTMANKCHENTEKIAIDYGLAADDPIVQISNNSAKMITFNKAVNGFYVAVLLDLFNHFMIYRSTLVRSTQMMIKQSGQKK